MPPLLAEALIALAPAVFGGTLIGSVTTGLAVAYGITAVAAIGAQFAFSRVQANRNKKQKGDLQITQMMIKQPIPVRTMAFGETKLGGAVFYDDAAPVLFQPLLLGIVHCEGPIHRFLGILFNDTATAVAGAAGTDAGGVNAALPWAFYISIESRRGTATQGASSILSSQRGLTSFSLKGLAYTVIMCTQPARPDKNFQYYYPNGVPTVNAVIEGSYIFDPRDGSQDWDDESTWKYTKNSALIILWFLTYFKIDAAGKKIARGMNIPHDMINLDSFSAFADMCDQTYQSLYTLNPFDGSAVATPRNEPRYECGGSYNLNEAPADVLNKLLATCDGTLYTDSNGLVCIRGGSYDAPTVLINDDMILQAELSKGSGVYEKFNRVKISFNATNMGWQIVEGHPWDNTPDIDDNGTLAEDLTLEYVHSYSQARRLAKIAMAKGNPDWVYSRLLCTFAAANVLGEEFVHVKHTLPGIDQPFLVHSVKLMPEQGLVELSLTSIDPAAYAWNPLTDDAIPPTPQGGTG